MGGGLYLAAFEDETVFRPPHAERRRAQPKAAA
jgi:hypothetical protein